MRNGRKNCCEERKKGLFGGEDAKTVGRKGMKDCLEDLKEGLLCSGGK